MGKKLLGILASVFICAPAFADSGASIEVMDSLSNESGSVQVLTAEVVPSGFHRVYDRTDLVITISPEAEDDIKEMKDAVGPESSVHARLRRINPSEFPSRVCKKGPQGALYYVIMDPNTQWKPAGYFVICATSGERRWVMNSDGSVVVALD